MLGRRRTVVSRSMFRTVELRGMLRRLATAASAAMFPVSLAVITFAAGLLFAQNEWFPATTVAEAQKTLTAVMLQLFRPFAAEQFKDFSGGAIKDIQKNRIVVRAPAPPAAADEHFLISGGLHQYLEYCPDAGCIAVEFSRAGDLVRAYPYRPEQLEANRIVSLPYEQVLFDFAENAYPWGVLKLPGGHLIATFNQWGTFPYGGGIARLRPDGSVVWFRHDYSHHWPRQLVGGEIAVPATRVAGSRISAPLMTGVDVHLDCEGKIAEDIVRIIDPDGRVIQEIPVLQAFLRSPYRGMLVDLKMPCFPLHLNYVASVTPGIQSLYNDVSPDDLVISLRDVNAFAILGRRDERLKHLFTGTFLRQHGVQPLGQSATMLIFDNHGADWRAGPSRLLAYDLADRSERTLLPNAGAPGVGISSDIKGTISVSHDQARVIVTSSADGRAYEIGIADGKVLTVFNNIHDLSRVPAAGEARLSAAARFFFHTVEYVR